MSEKAKEAAIETVSKLWIASAVIVVGTLVGVLAASFSSGWGWTRLVWPF